MQIGTQNTALVRIEQWSIAIHMGWEDKNGRVISFEIAKENKITSELYEWPDIDHYAQYICEKKQFIKGIQDFNFLCRVFEKMGKEKTQKLFIKDCDIVKINYILPIKQYNRACQMVFGEEIFFN
ncbi:MAG: hypothetical protein ACOCQR_03155 [bacterium]